MLVNPKEIGKLSDPELEELLHVRFFKGDPARDAGWCVSNPVWMGRVLDRIKDTGWAVETRTFWRLPHPNLEAEDGWYVMLTCNRGPCEAHGNDIHNWHGVAAKSLRLQRALCEAALLSTFPARDLKGIPSSIDALICGPEEDISHGEED